jgi:hypothetical protein
MNGLIIWLEVPIVSTTTCFSRKTTAKALHNLVGAANWLAASLQITQEENERYIL